MNRRYAVVGIFIFLLSASAACLSPEVAGAERRLISVNGHAEIRVVPDEVIVSLGIETSNADLSRAKSENDTRVTAVIAAAEERGIPREHIRTEYLQIQPVYDSQDKTIRFLHYRVRKTMVITLRDIPRFESLLSSALEAGANYVHGVDFRTTELRKHRDHARALAIGAARDKAAAMAKELGESIGRTHSVQEGYSRWWSWYGSWWGRYGGGGMAQNVVQTAAAPTDGVESPTTPGQITIDARVSVSFEIRE